MKKLLTRLGKIFTSLLGVLPRKKKVDSTDKYILSGSIEGENSSKARTDQVSIRKVIVETINQNVEPDVNKERDIDLEPSSDLEINIKAKPDIEAETASIAKGKEEETKRQNTEQSTNQHEEDKNISDWSKKEETSIIEEERKLKAIDAEIPRWVRAEGKNDNQTSERIRPIKRSTIESLRCSIRTTNALYRAGINRIDDIQGMSFNDLLSINNFGEKGLEELSSALEDAGYVAINEVWWKKNKSPDTQSEATVQENDQHKNTSKLEIISTEIAEKISGKENAEEIKDKISKYIKEAIENPNSQTMQKTIDEIYKLCSQLVDGEVRRNSMIAIMNASDFYQYPSSYGEEEKFRLKISTLILIEKIFEREYLKNDGADFAKNLRKYCGIEQDSPLHLFQRAMAGETHQRIGDSLKLPITREGVRQKIEQVGRIFLIKPKESQKLVSSALEHEIANDLAKIYSKEVIKLSNLRYESIKKLMSTANLRERLEIIQERLRSVPSLEYDYHYETINNKAESSVGTGYWNDIERLRQYLYRHAATQGTPHLMPKQITLPNAVRGAVTRFGGQNYVAKKIGLEYQGQLVAEGQGGRTYWDSDRVRGLIQKINNYLGKPDKNGVSQKDIRNYFEFSEDTDLIGKKVNSLLAAIERLDICLDDETSAELWTLKIRAKNEAIKAPESLPKEYNYISKSETVFIPDASAAAKMREEDQELKKELDAIFADKSDQHDPDPDEKINNASRDGVNKIFDLQEVLFLIKQELSEDLIESSIIRNYATDKKLMLASLLDRINEGCITITGEALLEEEDENTLYINKTALDKLISIVVL